MEIDARERQLITEAVTALPEPQKLVMTGIYWEGVPEEHLAELTGLDPASVNRLHQRTLTTLCRQLNKTEKQLNADGRGVGHEAPNWKHIGKGQKGSKRRLQEWVELQPALLGEHLREKCPSLDAFMTGSPKWLSPLRPSLYRELQDDLWRIAGLEGNTPQQAAFWPNAGPVWDAVALVPGHDRDGVLLVEAKSHDGEFKSDACGATNPRSRQLIEDSLADLCGELGDDPEISWMQTYYQLANRLAFLWHMREREIPTWLAWIYFVGDRFQSGRAEVVGPKDEAGWQPLIEMAYGALALSQQHSLSDFTVTIYPEAEPSAPESAPEPIRDAGA